MYVCMKVSTYVCICMFVYMYVVSVNMYMYVVCIKFKVLNMKVNVLPDFNLHSTLRLSCSGAGRSEGPHPDDQTVSEAYLHSVWHQLPQWHGCMLYHCTL